MLFVTVIGARPQFIKAAALSRAFAAQRQHREIIVNTGQHYDDNMSKVFFDELAIPHPNYSLNIGSGSHGAATGRMLEAVEKVLLECKPDMVIVFGDTNSTLAGALAAAKLNIPVAHIEAGLRSFNRAMPEEVNRVVTDHVSRLLFPPTENAVKHLRDEGIGGTAVHNCGDVMYDVALFYAAKAQTDSRALERLKLTPKQFVLSTIHRAENTDNLERLRTIVTALHKVAESMPVILPLHPRTNKMLKQANLLTDASKLTIIEPVGYLDMVTLEKNAKLIVTDSGGIQKEAFFYHVPCVTLRDETEWTELVDLGWNRLSPPLNTERVLQDIHAALDSRGKDANPYGDGKAAEKIVDTIGHHGR